MVVPEGPALPAQGVYRALRREAGPGPDGMRNEYLMDLSGEFADPLASLAIKAHEAAAERFLNADLHQA